MDFDKLLGLEKIRDEDDKNYEEEEELDWVLDSIEDDEEYEGDDTELEELDD